MLIAAALLFLIPLILLALAQSERPAPVDDWRERATERAMANPHAWPYGDED